MHAQNKFYFKGVSEQYIVASGCIHCLAILTVPTLKVKIMHFGQMKIWQLIFLNSAY